MKRIDFIPDIPVATIKYANVIIIILIIILLILFLFIEKPETIIGQCVISGNNQPERLVSKSFGYVRYLHVHGDSIYKDEDIAYIGSEITYYQINRLNSQLNNLCDFSLIDVDYFDKYTSLGEITESYNGFIQAVNYFNDLKKSELHTLNSDRYIIEQESSKVKINNLREDLNYQLDILSVYDQDARMDSILYFENSITYAAYKESKLKLLQQKENVRRIRNEIIQQDYQLILIENELSKLQSQYSLDIINAKREVYYRLDILKSNLKIWKNKYVFTSDISGIVENVYRIEDYQFISEGMEIARILPSTDSIKGQIVFSNERAANIENSMKVKIFLNDYNKDKYGFLIGSICNMSKSLMIDSESGPSYTANLLIDFEDQPFFNADFNLIQGMRGEAHIIINSRPLILSVVNWAKEIFDYEF